MKSFETWFAPLPPEDTGAWDSEVLSHVPECPQCSGTPITVTSFYPTPLGPTNTGKWGWACCWSAYCPKCRLKWGKYCFLPDVTIDVEHLPLTVATHATINEFNDTFAD